MAFYERLAWDPEVRRDTRVHVDPVTDTLTIEKIVDVEPSVKYKASLFNSRRRGDRWHGERGCGEHVAHIPMHIWWDLMQRGITRNQKKFAKWLNSTEGSFWKTRPGQV